MHMADALLAPAVAATMYGMSAVSTGVSIKKVGQEDIKEKLPEMAVMSALVFAGQMINYTIPGTGSSGHLCGGVLLSAILGPFAGFLSMIAVLLVQCLFFADGGLMALGANIWNMAFYGCFVGYLLVYRNIIKTKDSGKERSRNNTRIRIIIGSILACVISLQLGAFSVTLETSLSGITELPFASFVLLMQPIHLAIGLVEGLITAAVLVFVYEAREDMLYESKVARSPEKKSLSRTNVIVILAVLALLTGGIFSLYASSNPDGLEWSLFGNEEAGYSANMGLDEEDYGIVTAMDETSEKIVDTTAFMPDYAFKSDSESGTSVAGIVGSIIVAALAGVICLVGGSFRRKVNR